MGENTKIEWTDHTFNPWVGCTKISPACDHCYAEEWAKRTGNADLWQGERRRTSIANWRKPLKWNQDAERSGVRAKVFCASLADVFDNQVPEQWRADLWALIRATPLLKPQPKSYTPMVIDISEPIENEDGQWGQVVTEWERHGDNPADDDDDRNELPF